MLGLVMPDGSRDSHPLSVVSLRSTHCFDSIAFVNPHRSPSFCTELVTGETVP